MKTKRSLRSSKDIYHRIKWGGGIPVGKIVIGCRDRMAGIKEIAFVEFRPGGRIPWDRVRYFKLDGVFIWDRSKRIDLIFASGETAESDKMVFEAVHPSGLPSEFEEKPCYAFDEEKGIWRAWTESATGKKIEKLSLVSFNVLRTDQRSESFHHELRIPAILRELESLQADVIALQEVMPPFFEMMLRLPWVRQSYFISEPPEMRADQSLTEVILSKIQPDKVLQLQFSKAKKAVGLRLTLNGHPLDIFTLHLSSDMATDGAGKRERYLRQLNHALRQSETILLAGDFNQENPEHFLNHNFENLWDQLNPDDPGLTFDTKNNPFAALCSQSGKARRLDHILLLNRSQQIIPQSLKMFGTQVRERHGKHFFLSDHFGMVASFQTRPTYASLKMALTTQESALVFIPNPKNQAQIQAIRKEYDGQFERWMPHINLLYGFLHESLFPSAALLIRQAMAEVPFFRMNLESFDYFEHKESTTLWLRPDEIAFEKLKQIQTVLQNLFPQCKGQDRSGKFTPHLTVAKILGRNRGEAMRLKNELKSSWPKLELEVDSLCLISRNGNRPFEIKEVIPLGEEWNKKSFSESGLGTSLGILGLLPGYNQQAAKELALTELEEKLEEVAPKSKLYSIGSVGMGIDSPTSDLDILCIGKMSHGLFFRRMDRNLRNQAQFRVVNDALVPLLKFEMQGVPVDLMYVSYPEALDLKIPSQLSTEEFQQFGESDRMALAGSLEVAALRRFIGEDMPAFRLTVLALKAWARARQIDENAFGYPGGLAWTLLVAATPPEESPDLWLQRCFEWLVLQDWQQPILLTEGFHQDQADAAMQVITAAFPRQNVTRNVGHATLKVLKFEFEQALEQIWDIQNGKAYWRELFTSNPESHFEGLEIHLKMESSQDLFLCQGWVKKHVLGLILSLEKICSKLRPWTNFLRGSDLEGCYQISLKLHNPETQGLDLNAILGDLEEKFNGWKIKPMGARLYCRIQ